MRKTKSTIKSVRVADMLLLHMCVFTVCCHCCLLLLHFAAFCCFFLLVRLQSTKEYKNEGP